MQKVIQIKKFGGGTELKMKLSNKHVLQFFLYLQSQRNYSKNT